MTYRVLHRGLPGEALVTWASPRWWRYALVHGDVEGSWWFEYGREHGMFYLRICGLEVSAPLKRRHEPERCWDCHVLLPPERLEVGRCVECDP